MKKREHLCPECDNFFEIKFSGGDPVGYCPFCSADLVQEDANDFSEDD